MVQPPEILTHLVRTAFGRAPDPATPDGKTAEGGIEERLASTLLVADPPAIGDGEGAQTDEFDPGVVAVLADKVLLAWLRNRYQLLFPFALDLKRLDSQQAELVAHAMIAAAQADGTLDGKERERIEGALSLADAGNDRAAWLTAALEQPKTLNEVLRQVQDVQTGALVYAASLMAVDHRKPVNRYYLKYLAARLQLSDELVDSLEQRFRSTG
jgi:hypothetical protein